MVGRALISVELFCFFDEFLSFSLPVTDQGVSWCPDCNAVVETLKAALVSGHLVEVLVRRAEYKGVADYSLRRDKRVRLTTIPTFGRWVGGRIEMRLEDMQIADHSLLDEVVHG